MSPLLLSIKQAAERLGISQSALRILVASSRIEHVRLGKSKVMLPAEAIHRFVIQNTVQVCPAATTALGSAFSTSAAATTSSGLKVDAAASAAAALQIAERLKSRSPSSSAPLHLPQARATRQRCS